jgi:hypothetical protein
VERVRANFRAANEMQVPFRTEYRLRQWDGEYRWYIDSAMPRFDGAGEFVGYIGSVIDIEDRRRAEQRSARASGSSARWWRTPRPRVERAARRVLRLLQPPLGRVHRPPPESMEGWGWQAVHDPAVLPRGHRSLDAQPRHRRPVRDGVPAPGGDGVFRWFLAGCSRCATRRADHPLVRDGDQRRRAAAAGAALRDALAARDTFLSVASHELRTPAHPLSLKLEMLAREARGALPAPFAQRVLGYTDATRRQVSRLSSLVSDLLDVSRIAAGRFTVVREPVDLAAVVREVVARAEPQAHRAGSRLSLDAPRPSRPSRTGSASTRW